jgi:transcriptional regulator with XRE-family HTH domain
VINNKNEIIIKAFGKRLKELRRSKQLSQERLGHRVQMTVSQIGRIERGEINTSISTMYNLSLALNIPFKILTNFDVDVDGKSILAVDKTKQNKGKAS